MCGIYGAVSLGGKIDIAIIKGLTWANRQRGTDSVGFFDSNGKRIRRACDPATALAEKDVQAWLNDFDGWAIAGHTRHATQGTVTKRNAHPFRFGHIIGTHNGIVDSPAKYIVDSEYLIDLITTSGYQALNDVCGYWGLAWFDSNDESFWLAMHDGQLSFTVRDDVVYYSSDSKHLASIVGGDSYSFKEGQVVCFCKDGSFKDSEQGHIPGLDVKESWATSIGFHTCGVVSKDSRGTTYKGSRRRRGKAVRTAGKRREDRKDWEIDEDYQTWVERREAGGSAFDDINPETDAWANDSDDTELELRNKGLHEMSEAEFKTFCTGEGEIGGEG